MRAPDSALGLRGASLWGRGWMGMEIKLMPGTWSVIEYIYYLLTRCAVVNGNDRRHALAISSKEVRSISGQGENLHSLNLPTMCQ
jgi:hypothetical protein